MRNRSSTTPRRRGPKYPLPRDKANYEIERFEEPNASESPYYTIDNTEDIYGTTLLPSQRCYVDPWDLENYDYVRKKLESPHAVHNDYYEASLSPSPSGESPLTSNRYYEPPLVAPRMAATMPRNRRRSHFQCELPCCVVPPVMAPRRRHYEELELREGLYGARAGSQYREYMVPEEEEDVEQNVYIGYGGFSSSSSTEQHSSIGEDSLSVLMPRHSPIYGGGRRSNAGTLVRAAPKLEFPAPPSSMPPSYDYCNPYATLPCSASDCYECMSQAQNSSSLIYAAPSAYGSSSIYDGAGYSSTLGRRPSSSLYDGIYSSKFGLSKKGLLQIDYSCSWNDLDRVMGRHY